MSITDGARGNELQQLRARLAALEALVAVLPSRFAAAKTSATYRYFNKVAHGFTVGQIVRHNGTTWVKSQADTEANAAIGGMVVSIPHVNAFVIAMPGSYVVGVAVTAGLNYLSAATAGALTTTAPALKAPAFMADSTTTGILLAGAGGSSMPTKTDDGWVFCTDSSGNGEWTRTLDLGKNATGGAGKIQVYSPNAAGVAVEIDGALVTASGKKMTVREIDVCDAGVAKKMLVLASPAY